MNTSDKNMFWTSTQVKVNLAHMQLHPKASEDFKYTEACLRALYIDWLMYCLQKQQNITHNYSISSHIYIVIEFSYMTELNNRAGHKNDL